ncbi:phage tail tape measure protein [Bacillus suaedae]|uniref:Phage tail tape measure protein n=2 Tax=Halalkalibacter suaedae TaxID=2822140 RepID=A0A940WWB8_9BACI|nr:phage tail tape measure protein [Bacillus suaedae]MBP3953615.1 phage tail tape measure protein [Bacillus suaedae]
MAKNIKGITIEIDGETKGLDKALQGVNKQSRDLQGELRQVERGLKFNPESVELLAQKQQLLTEQIGATSDKLNQLKGVQSQVETQFKSGEIGEAQYRAFQRELVETESKLNHFESELKSTEKGFNSLADKAKETGESFQKTGDKMSSVGATLSTSVSLPMAALGGIALKSASDVEAAQGKIQAQLGLTAEEAKELDGVARELFNDAFGESMEDVNQSLVTVKQNIKGLNDEDLKTVTENAYILQDAFGADIQESTKTASTLMKNFGIDADEAFDLMTRGFQEGGDYSGELLDSLNEYAPQFSALGMGSDDMVNTLLKGAEAGAFSLDKVGDAVKEFNIRAKDGSESTSEAFANLKLNAGDMQEAFTEGGEAGKEAFNQVMESLSGMDDEILRNETGVALFGTQWEDLESDVVTALGTTKDLLGETEGATQKAGDAMYDNFGSRIVSVLRDLQDSILPLGLILLDMAEKWLPKINSAIQKMADWFGELSPKGQEIAVVIGAIAAAIGPVLLVIGTLISFIGSAITVFTAVSGAIATAGGAMAIITGPIGIAVAAIVGLIAIGIALYKNWDEIKENAVVTFSDLGEFIRNFVNLTVGFFTNLKDQAMDKIKTLTNYMTQTIENMKNVIMGIVGVLVGLFTGDLEKMKEGSLKIVGSLKAQFTNFVELLKSGTLGKVGQMVGSVVELMGSMLSKAVGKVKGLYDGAVGWFNNLLNKAGEVASNIVSKFTRINLKQIGINIIRGLIDGISEQANALWAKAKEIANGIKGTLESALLINSPSKVTMAIGDSVGKGLEMGMDYTMNGLKKKASEMAQAVTPKVEQTSFSTEGYSRNLQTQALGERDRRPAIINVQVGSESLARVLVDDINQLQAEQTVMNYMNR